MRSGREYVHLTDAETEAQRASQGAQSHPASEGLSEDVNLQEMVFKGAGLTPGPGTG